MADPVASRSLRYRGKSLVRLVGGALLTACAVMVVLGLTVLSERLQGLTFIRYWTWCLLIALAAIVMALLDMALIHHASSRLRRQLFREQFLPPSGADSDTHRPH